MQPDPHPAFDLIEEARFARRMLGVLDTSLAKIIDAGAALPVCASMKPARPARLEVPTVNPEGWTDEVLALIRSGRAMGATPQEIAGEVAAMFGLSVSPQVLLAAVMHFDLDRRDAAPVPEQQQQEPEAPIEPPCDGMTGAEWLAKQGAAPVADQPCEASPVVAHEAASVIDEAPAAAPAWPCPNDPAVNEPWAQKALAMHAEGELPARIASALKWHGASDFKVRCLLIPGFRERARENVNAARGRAPGKVDAAEAPAPTPADPDQAREDARLRELRTGGASFPEIAAIMKREGFKARSVRGWIGRADRLGINVPKGRPLPPVAVPKPQPREPETKPQPKPAPARRAIAKASPAVLPWSIPEREPGAGCNTEIPAPGKGLHIGELQSDHCRWLMGKGADGHETYCGCQKSRHGSAYCDAHAKRAYTEWPPAKPLKRPTRMARALSALPDARNRQHERTT